MNPRTVDEVIKDFKGRRAGIIEALTKDVELFYQKCDPKQPNLCLFGLPNERWEVTSPPLPTPLYVLPEPRSGINLVRDDMPKKEWLSMVALHSDAWLHAVASYFSVKHRFDEGDRKRLFNDILEVSSISEEVTDGRARKRSKVVNCGLPNEMLVEVLARLPVKNLLRYRLVCNNWRSLIDDPVFVSAHLGSYKGNIMGSQLLIIKAAPRASLNNEQVLIRRSDTFRHVMKVENLDAGYHIIHIMGCVNGLVLARDRYLWSFKHITLWNPSINKSLKVPNPMVATMTQSSHLELGLGFDGSTNDYKIVAVTYPHAHKYRYDGDRFYYVSTVPGLVHVYTLSTNSWTELGVQPPLYWLDGAQVYVNGVIHWIGPGPNFCSKIPEAHPHHIVSFDVRNEVFNYFELCGGIKEAKDNFLTFMDGCLAMFCADDCLKEIWVMKEYGNSNSWSKCFTFTLKYDKLLHIKPNGELLYAVDGIGIKSYDVKRNHVRNMAKTYSRASKYTILTHVESLVLISLPKNDN